MYVSYIRNQNDLKGFYFHSLCLYLVSGSIYCEEPKHLKTFEFPPEMDILKYIDQSTKANFKHLSECVRGSDILKTK